MTSLAAALAGEGWRVVSNKIYKGGYTTAHYGDFEGVDAIQIEMCQRVYMDELMPEEGPRHRSFDIAGNALRRVFTALAARIA